MRKEAGVCITLLCIGIRRLFEELLWMYSNVVIVPWNIKINFFLIFISFCGLTFTSCLPMYFVFSAREMMTYTYVGRIAIAISKYSMPILQGKRLHKFCHWYCLFCCVLYFKFSITMLSVFNKTGKPGWIAYPNWSFVCLPLEREMFLISKHHLWMEWSAVPLYPRMLSVPKGVWLDLGIISCLPLAAQRIMVRSDKKHCWPNNTAATSTYINFKRNCLFFFLQFFLTTLKSTGALEYHGSSRFFSDQKINITKPQTVGTGQMAPIMKAHGEQQSSSKYCSLELNF